jgi:hypothetical protein
LFSQIGMNDIAIRHSTAAVDIFDLGIEPAVLDRERVGQGRR